ncbi:3(or 17)beta-hydroxysteroid dehydrogenase [Pseudomonas linyingensis]|uniref:3(Or 17)beta-hydroxysteroid dehydrogenase n=1 Tax=Pseudomonas linyingensis TaxID=915471 RepID=A0A1H7BSW0_9PSED|nr:SDR family oxidoreductase [Pseudomonas linyingensis]SEJ76495.1 3(or 17)beta-hydroxysteroid dehydrogenase [Pseudomonas linyingensis]
MGRVAGKVVLITGAASGLGAADARLLAQEGARVVLTDVNEELGREVASSIPGALFLTHDVRDELRWKEVIAETLAHFGRLDVLVNNAGVVIFGDVENISLEQYRFVNAVMSEGTFLGCKHAIPAMHASGGGSIINISSIGAIKGIGEVFSYAAAKGAILSMTRSVAIHCQDKGYKIRCNAILPGGHETPMTAAALRDIDPDSHALSQVKKEMGQPVDVANLVLFLASDESRYINGTQMVIDNAETIK